MTWVAPCARWDCLIRQLGHILALMMPQTQPTALKHIAAMKQSVLLSLWKAETRTIALVRGLWGGVPGADVLVPFLPREE